MIVYFFTVAQPVRSGVLTNLSSVVEPNENTGEGYTMPHIFRL